MKTLNEVHTLNEYSTPLMEIMASIPPNEKGYSCTGGHSCRWLELSSCHGKVPGEDLSSCPPDSIHA
ncbi:unnamed protein product [Camellia sinensis]